MPVDTIKFDISLIQGMLDDRLHKMVIELAAMLRGLNFDLVAEGIESDELLSKATNAGFEYVQGFYFGTPQPLAALSSDNNLKQIHKSSGSS
jgi:EAL domain-containing protein (putative c-di-GMP-specific phosphodiesterase class I)